METFSAWMRLEIPRSKSPLVPSLRSAATAKLTSGPAMVSELPTWTPTRAARSITAAVRFQNHDEQRNHLDHLETCGGKIRGTNRKRWHFWNQNNDGKTPRRFLRLAMEICTKNRSQSLDWDAESFKSIVSRGSTKGQIKVYIYTYNYGLLTCPNPSCCFGLGCVRCLRCLGLRLINQ